MAETPRPGETSRIPFDTASPPEEVSAILQGFPMAMGSIEGWLAIPTLRTDNRGVSLKEISTGGEVDAYALISPLLGKRELDESLRLIDTMNGCIYGCDTCLADAALPSKMFSYGSLEKLFSDPRFISMLQPDSLRFGSAGDILNHPQGVDIATMALEQTAQLDARRFAETGTHHQIKVYSNFRAQNADKLDQMLSLAVQHPDRFYLNISLPLNKRDSVSKMFDDYARGRPEVFGTDFTYDNDGLINFSGLTQLPNVQINDIRHVQQLYKMGRVLSDPVLRSKVPDNRIVEPDQPLYFKDRGLAKTFFNPDALWLMIYATGYESHTNRVFTPLTPQNLFALSHVPYHPDFPTPPTWPGGTGRLKRITEIVSGPPAFPGAPTNDGTPTRLRVRGIEGKQRRPLNVIH